MPDPVMPGTRYTGPTETTDVVIPGTRASTTLGDTPEQVAAAAAASAGTESVDGPESAVEVRIRELQERDLDEEQIIRQLTLEGFTTLEIRMAYFGESQEEATATLQEEAANMTPGEASEAVLSQWRSAGIDVDDPIVLSVLPAARDAFQSGDTSTFSLLTTSMTAAFQSTAQKTYEEVRKDLHLTGTQVEWQLGMPGMPGQFDLGRSNFRPGTNGVDVNSETGGVLYANGVVYDPNTGQVTFPAGALVEGSEPWLNHSRTSWDEEDIQSWKQTLIDYGYMPKGAAKDATWTVTFENALRSYFQNKYSHYGDPVPLEEGSPGYAGAPPIEDLHAVRATVASDVEAQYKLMYGELPTPEESERWVRFAIRLGNKLQRTQGLSAGTAETEAIARIGQRFEASPMGEHFAEAQENTELRDRITAAASAASSMIGR